MKLLEALQSCAKAATQDKEFISATAGLSCRILLEVQSSEERAQVVAVGGESASAIYLSASPQVWQQIMLPLPPVGWHSFTAATRQTEMFSVRADAIELAQGLHALERLFEILRGQASEEAVAGEPLDLSGLTGRYATLRLGDSERLTVYHESSGAIALEAPFRSSGRRTVHLTHAQVNQAAHNPGYVRGLMSPSSPLRHRRNAAWVYSQGGFQIYPGDLAFYSDEFDAAVDVQGLDGSDRPIHLLTGSYDYSATPDDSMRVADLIPGAVFTEMADMGHFPMIENPAAFLRHLAPVLESVRARLN